MSDVTFAGLKAKWRNWNDTRANPLTCADDLERLEKRVKELRDGYAECNCDRCKKAAKEFAALLGSDEKRRNQPEEGKK